MKHIRILGHLIIFLTLSYSTAILAQSYPVRPIRFVVAYPAGTSVDAIARIVATEMEKHLGQSVVLEFKTGASGSIGAKAVVTAPHDGYTFYYGQIIAFHPLILRNNAVDAGKELAPVSHFVSAPFFVVSSGKLPVNSYGDMVAYAKANPGKLKHGSAAPNVNLLMTMLKERTGIESQNIPYKVTVQVAIALVAGELEWAAAGILPFMPHIQAGRIRPLFVAAEKRAALLPNVPTSAEVGIRDFKVGINHALWAPLGTPREVIQKVSAAAAAALKIPEIAQQIRLTHAAEPIGSTPEGLMQMFDSEIRFWSEAAKLANFRPE